MSYTPGIDRIGTVVPTTALATTNQPGAAAGLVRTETDPAGNVVSTKVVTNLDGKQTDLVRGNTYTYDGYVNVPTSDTYQFWLAASRGHLLR